MHNVSKEYTKKDNVSLTLRDEICNNGLNSSIAITERCDYLDRFQKILDYKLHFYLTNKLSGISIKIKENLL